MYTNRESHNAQPHRQTDRRTAGQQDDANSRLYCVAVRWAKNLKKALNLKNLFLGEKLIPNFFPKLGFLALPAGVNINLTETEMCGPCG